MEKPLQTQAPIQTQAQPGDRLLRVLMFTLMVSSMSALMFNFVLPDISEQFGLSIAQVSWLTSAYTLIYAIGTVTYGKLADKFKLKHLLTAGLLLFAAGSLIGLASQSFWMALVGRCIQSAGASAIPATAVLIPVRYIAPERRGSALGMTAVGLALGSALGPVVASVIVSIAHWRWLFCVPLLLLLTLPYYRKYLGDEQGTAGPFDWLGGGLLAASVALLLLGVTNGAWLCIAGSAIFGALFIARIRSAAVPFVPPGLFANRSYRLGIMLAVLINGIGISLYFLSPLLLSRVFELPSYWIGFAMVPAAAASAVLGRRGGKLADAKGNAYLFCIASGLLLACFALLSSFTAVSPLLIAAFLIFGNVGQSFMLIAMSNSISRTMPKEQVGVGMGIFSMLNFMTQGIATGVYGKLVDLPGAAIWNPVSANAGSAVFSNIYMVLAALHVVIWLIYYARFVPRKKTGVQVGS
ncbi:Putative multidrug resistance protein MdtD [Paenibacillus solanacearum]|uniref:Multidrug resistance protein MdtD n=1 Tax=Paenibacillus solanacearum TaxID=2048548 RepID=A0A916NRX5_9BACL|nr:MFS transporter [Paenibacillus solanacearum]CAG7645977.1 Putative multidrug resistance protein MdtD [Paenibacillus solanacearum]